MRLQDIYFVKLTIYIYRNFIEKRLLLSLFLLALLFNVLSLILVSFKGRPENFLIPLHYSAAGGIDKIGPWFYIYEIPLAGFLILVINFFIAFNLRKSNDLKGAYILAGATIFLEIFFLLGSLFLVFRT